MYNWGMEEHDLNRWSDRRNLVDEFKGLANEVVREKLEERRNDLEVAIWNVSHDFNAGSIVRTANNFNVAKVHIVGRKKYNRRGAMCTDKYLEIMHWESVAEWLADQRERRRRVVAIENNVAGARGLGEGGLAVGMTMVFGGESDGLCEEILREADEVRCVESFGSTRSVNVGVAAGIAMYEWVREVVL